MRATIYNGPHSLEVVERSDPVIQAPTDAIVRVSLGCVCGSDLWYFRGESPHAPGPIGHEFIGIVEDIGAEVHGLAKGDLVVAPFTFSDGTCPNCRAGVTSKCIAGGSFGNHGVDGGQGEAVRVPLASSTLVRVADARHTDTTMRSLAALTDVMCTGHHAAVSAGVRPGAVVAVVGDGAVGSRRDRARSAWARSGSSLSAGIRNARRSRESSALPTFSRSAAAMRCRR